MKKVITNREAGYYIANRYEFRVGSGRSFSGRWEGNKYVVYSYYTPIYEWEDGVHWVNQTRYSVTTSRQQGFVRGSLSWTLPDEIVNVYHVPVGARNLSNHTGKIGHERAERIRQAA